MDKLEHLFAAIGTVAVIWFLGFLVVCFLDWIAEREANRNMLTDSRNNHESRLIDLEVEVRFLKSCEQDRTERENKKARKK